MVETGWAAFFPIYPSLPNNDDMNRAIEAAEQAWEDKLGHWTLGEDLLLAYEYRACIKLAGPTGVARKEGNDNRNFYTVADLDAQRASLLADGWEISESTAADLASNAFQRICVDLRDLSSDTQYCAIRRHPVLRTCR